MKCKTVSYEMYYYTVWGVLVYGMKFSLWSGEEPYEIN